MRNIDLTVYNICCGHVSAFKGEEEGEQYKSQGALAVGSRRYTGELMPSTLCHGGTGTFFHERERKQQRADNLLHRKGSIRKNNKQ